MEDTQDSGLYIVYKLPEDKKYIDLISNGDNLRDFLYIISTRRVAAQFSLEQTTRNGEIQYRDSKAHKGLKCLEKKGKIQDAFCSSCSRMVTLNHMTIVYMEYWRESDKIKVRLFHLPFSCQGISLCKPGIDVKY